MKNQAATLLLNNDLLTGEILKMYFDSFLSFYFWNGVCKLTRQPFLAAREIELSNISGLIMVFLAATKRTKMKLGSVIRNSIINTSVQTFLWIGFSVAGSPNYTNKITNVGRLQGLSLFSQG